MRPIIAIMAIYIFSLTIFPCADEVGVYAEHQHVEQSDNAPSSNACHNQCTPFCVCECCRLPIVDYHVPILPMIAEISRDINYIDIEEQPFRGHYSSIWRPPVA